MLTSVWREFATRGHLALGYVRRFKALTLSDMTVISARRRVVLGRVVFGFRRRNPLSGISVGLGGRFAICRRPVLFSGAGSFLGASLTPVRTSRGRGKRGVHILL